MMQTQEAKLAGSKPLCIDLFCGLGGWSEGFLAEGWDCVGFDVERHVYGDKKYPAQLVLQDVLTLHGSQFRNADMIVASPPCQKYSYLAMPWSRSTSNNSQAAKALRREWETNGPDNRLFDACFRIQKEAIEAAGQFIPLVVENVRGAQPWVGRAAWNFGSYYLWGDIPALMPRPVRAQKMNPDGTNHPQGSWFAIADSVNRGSGRKVSMNFHEHAKTGKPGTSFQSVAVADTFGWSKETPLRDCNSKSPRRKAASAQIAKIPFELSSYIARCYKPERIAA